MAFGNHHPHHHHHHHLNHYLHLTKGALIHLKIQQSVKHGETPSIRTEALVVLASSNGDNINHGLGGWVPAPAMNVCMHVQLVAYVYVYVGLPLLLHLVQSFQK